jgi:hypothetical protein
VALVLFVTQSLPIRSLSLPIIPPLICSGCSESRLRGLIRASFNLLSLGVASGGWGGEDRLIAERSRGLGLELSAAVDGIAVGPTSFRLVTPSAP